MVASEMMPRNVQVEKRSRCIFVVAVMFDDANGARATAVS